MKNKKGRRNRNNKQLPCKPKEDRLTKLPNEVLLNILERVDTIDAVRTCILSRQMVKLPTMLARLVIDVCSFVPKEHKGSRLTLRDVIRINGAMADATDSILNSRSQQITLHQLSLRFCLRYYDCLSIGKTVAHTMATQKLDTAEFTILTEREGVQCTDADLLYFAKQFKMFFGACPDAFAGLTHLRLENMRFGESDIPNILSTCKRLESLRFRNCDTGIETVLQVEHPQLVELEISYGTFETVELTCLPKLERMTYESWVSYGDPLSFGYVPELSRLSLINTGRIGEKVLKLSQFLANAPFISDLLLNFESEKIWVQPECPKLLAPVLEKLQLVNLVDLPEGCDIAWTSFILEAAPFLKELCITVWDHWCAMVTDKKVRMERGLCEKTDVEWESSASADFKHENLAVLTIFGFQPDNNFVTYIRRIMKAALNLKEVALYDRKVCRRCEYIDPTIKEKICPSRYPRTSEERDLLRKQITEGMGVASPAVIHFRS